MIVKNGRFGKFAACPNYPQCRSTKPLVKVNEEELAEEAQEEKKEEKQKPAQKKTVVADFKCEKCGSDMVLRTGRYGSFYACVNYPTCKTTKPRTKDIGVSCPKCSSKVVLKYGKNKSVFYSCEKYPTCDFSSWDMPINENCPNCGDILFRKKGKPVVVCNKPGCGFSKVATDLAPEEN